MNPRPALAASVALLFAALSAPPGFAQEVLSKVAQPVTDGPAGSVVSEVEALDLMPPETGPMAAPGSAINSSPEMPAAAAPTGSGTWNGLPNRFRLNVGGFRVEGTTVIRGDGTDVSEFDFEKEFRLPKIDQTLWVDATWQVGRRHQLSLTYTQVRRKGDEFTFDDEIEFDDEIFQAGIKASAEVNTSLVSGYYRFALAHSERFQIGPTLGIGYMMADVSLRATAPATVEAAVERGVPTGAVGGYVEGWLSRRLVLRGNLLYIKANLQGNDLSLVDGRVGLDVYPFRHVGMGAQYKYDKYRFDHTSDLGGKLTYQGVQYYVSFLF